MFSVIVPWILLHVASGVEKDSIGDQGSKTTFRTVNQEGFLIDCCVKERILKNIFS